MEQFYSLDDKAFESTLKVKFHKFKTGEHKFRLLPLYAAGKFYHQHDLHWGFTNENGHKLAIKCTKYSHKKCAICDLVDTLKGEIEQLKTDTTSDPNKIKELITIRETRMNEIKKNSTYLWNIMTEEGEQKVLQLSWNGHSPLLEKVKFYWEQKRISLFDTNNNLLIWCSRTGIGAKTRYQYEILEQHVRKLENLKPLIDLSVVYQVVTPSEIEKIVKNGFVENTHEDPIADKDFTAPIPFEAQTTQQPPIQHQATIPMQPIQPAVNNPVLQQQMVGPGLVPNMAEQIGAPQQFQASTPGLTLPSTNTPAPQPQAQLSEEKKTVANASYDDLMKRLNS